MKFLSVVVTWKWLFSRGDEPLVAVGIKRANFPLMHQTKNAKISIYKTS